MVVVVYMQILSDLYDSLILMTGWLVFCQMKVIKWPWLLSVIWLHGRRESTKRKKNVLSQSSCPHSFFYAHPFFLKWQIHIFPSICFLFLLFCQKLAIFLQIWKIKMQIIMTRSIWQQPCLVTTPQPVLSCLPCSTNKLYGTTVISTSGT